MAADRYVLDPHFLKRCAERRVTMKDVRAVVRGATRCEPYPDGPILAGGTCWRLFGVALDRVETSIGFEAFQDHLGRRIFLVTVF